MLDKSFADNLRNLLSAMTCIAFFVLLFLKFLSRSVLCFFISVDIHTTHCKNQIVGRNLRIVAHWWTLWKSHLLRLYFGVFQPSVYHTEQNTIPEVEWTLCEAQLGFCLEVMMSKQICLTCFRWRSEKRGVRWLLGSPLLNIDLYTYMRKTSDVAGMAFLAKKLADNLA